MTVARFPFIKTIDEPDVLYAITDLSILACAEVGTCIIATSAGTLRPLFVKQFGEGRAGREGRQVNLDLPSSQGPMTTVLASTGMRSANEEDVSQIAGPEVGDDREYIRTTVVVGKSDTIV